MSVRKKATPKNARVKAKATPSRRKEARMPAKKKPAAKPKRPAKKKPARAANKAPVAKKKPAKAAKAGSARKDAEREKALKAKEKEREKREREKAQKDAEREKALKAKEKEREQKAKEAERARKEAEREKALKAKEAEREKALKAKEAEREKALKAKEAEREKALKAKAAEREKKEREKEKARELKEREKEKARKEAEQKAARVAAQAAKDAERERIRREKEEERLQKIAERDAARDEAKRLKDEEKKAKDAEREAYRKAKEAERERIRAEREAARRALEGKVSRASKRAQRGDGIGRGVTTRQYRPDTIPNQSGTTRRHEENQRLLGVRLPAEIMHDPPRATHAPPPPPPPGPPQPAPPPALSVEERWAVINERLNGMDDQFQREYRESFEMSWVYHDSALEGVVYTFQELKTAIDPNMGVVADSGLQPVCDEIRRHRQAIEYVRELSEKKRVPITVDTIKKIYCILHPEEGDVKTVKYRKDIPQHRLYFHEYAAPDKIAYKARQVIDWLNGPEPKKLKSPIRIAARIHYDLLRVFPFPQDSGKVSRLLMNVLLMRAGHPPAIIHSTERQRYYEALKGQLPVIVSMVSESIMNALLSIEKKIEDHDATKSRSSSPPKEGEEKPEKPEKPASAIVAAATARDDDSDLYLDSEMEDSDSDSDGDSDEGGDED
jgi:Fic/DOC family protein